MRPKGDYTMRSRVFNRENYTTILIQYRMDKCKAEHCFEKAVLIVGMAWQNCSILLIGLFCIVCVLRGQIVMTR